MRGAEASLARPLNRRKKNENENQFVLIFLINYIFRRMTIPRVIIEFFLFPYNSQQPIVKSQTHFPHDKHSNEIEFTVNETPDCIIYCYTNFFVPPATYTQILNRINYYFITEEERKITLILQLFFIFFL